MADKNDPDIALMLRVKEEDLSAYEALVEKFKQPVMNLVYRLIHDLDEAEDIAQKPFVQVWKTRDAMNRTANSQPGCSPSPVILG